MTHSAPDRIDFGRRRLTVRLLGGRISWRIDLGAAGIAGLLLLLGGVLVVASLVSGKYPISLGDVYGVIAGRGEDMARTVVLEWRLPRVALAFLLGSSLGMSGAIFQSLTRNPLGSPDIIGFSTGSYTGALVVILLMSGGYYATIIGALTGGIATAAIIYVLAYRQGIHGFRLIVVGIGITAMLGAFNTWMIREAELEVAMSAAIWGAGSLNGLGVEQLVPVLFVLLGIAPLILLLSRPMRQLDIGDDTARASGADVDGARLGLMALGVALMAIVTAAAGPVSFIALAAPQIARRLTKTAGVPLICSGLMGGLLLMAADWAAQHAFGIQLPAGVMTVSIGGVYFLWLLIREDRK